MTARIEIAWAVARAYKVLGDTARKLVGDHARTLLYMLRWHAGWAWALCLSKTREWHARRLFRSDEVQDELVRLAVAKTCKTLLPRSLLLAPLK